MTKPPYQELSNLVTEFVRRRERTSFFRVDLDDIVSEAIKFERERVAGVLKTAEDTLEYCLRADPIESFYVNEALEKLCELKKKP